MMADDRRASSSTLPRGEFVQCREDGGTAERIGAPGVGAFAVIERAEERRRTDRRRHRHAVAQPLAENDDVRLEPVGFEREERSGAAEVRLHLVENENDVVLAAECLQQLQISLRRMIRTAAANVWLGDQHPELAAKLDLERLRVLREYGAGSKGRSRSVTSMHSFMGKLMKRTRGSRSWSVSQPVTAPASPFLP